MRDLLRDGAGKALFSLAFLLLLATVSGAQESGTIVDVGVQGNRVATTSLILGVSSLEKGSALSPTMIQETIKRLYGLGIFSDVSLTMDRVTGGIKITILVKELPKLSGLEFSGNKAIKAKELNEKLRFGIGGYISPFLIHQKQEEILRLYSEKGYFRAAISPSLEYSKDSSEALLKYRINEHSKVKVSDVIVTGNSRVQAKNLVKKMRNRKRGFLRSSDFAQDKYEEDLVNVIAEYHKRGFVDAYLISDSTSIDTTANRMKIFLSVYEGPRYHFGNVQFKNNKVIDSTRLVSKLKFHPGDIFDGETDEKSLYIQSLSELYTTYQDIGHLHVRIADQKSTRADSILDITYDITEGLPAHVNMIKIVGNTKTKDKVIRREMSMLPGQIFDRARLLRSVRDVMALNFFTNVTPMPVNLPNGDVDIEVKIEEKATGQISAGAGYNSQDKLVGTLSMGIPNFAGNGQNLSFSVDFGKSRSSYSVSFTEPWFRGRPTLVGADVYFTRRSGLEDYTEGRQGGSLSVGRRLRWPDDYFHAYAAYRLERNQFKGFSEAYRIARSYKSYSYFDQDLSHDFDASKDLLVARSIHSPYPGSLLDYEEKWLTASRLSFTISRDSRNLPEFATRGSQFAYTFENTGGFLGGFWHYQRHTIMMAKFIPVVGSIALAAKIKYALVTSPDGDDRILATDRFTPGGVGYTYDGVVRGYDDGSLTPDTLAKQTDTTFLFAGPPYSDPHRAIDTSYTLSHPRIPGKYVLVSNVELQVPIMKQQLYGILFFDAGNSWLHAGDIKGFGSLYKSVGFGFRIVVPGIGMIGFDFGYPLNNILNQKKGWRPQFQIGNTFGR